MTDEKRETPEDVKRVETMLEWERVEKRSLSEAAAQFLDSAAQGGGLALGTHIVNDAYGKVKDALPTPKEPPKEVELPPGVEKD